MLSRRQLLTAAGALAASRGYGFRTKFSRASISAIADEVAANEDELYSFARRFELQAIELRYLPGTRHEFALLSEPELKRWSAALGANKLKVSFLNSSAGERPEKFKADATAAIRAAAALGAMALGISTAATGMRPAGVKADIAYRIEEVLPAADAAKVKLAVTDADLLTLVTSKNVGLSWDTRERGTAWPAVNRLLKIHVEADRNLPAVLEKLAKDGYAGRISLSSDPEHAYEAMKDLQRAIGAV
jgi:hypothetical protein